MIQVTPQSNYAPHAQASRGFVMSNILVNLWGNKYNNAIVTAMGNAHSRRRGCRDTAGSNISVTQVIVIVINKLITIYIYISSYPPPLVGSTFKQLSSKALQRLSYTIVHYNMCIIAPSLQSPFCPKYINTLGYLSYYMHIY